jgi:hypothetical protein
MIAFCHDGRDGQARHASRERACYSRLYWRATETSRSVRGAFRATSVDENLPDSEEWERDALRQVTSHASAGNFVREATSAIVGY